MIAMSLVGGNMYNSALLLLPNSHYLKAGYLVITGEIGLKTESAKTL